MPGDQVKSKAPKYASAHDLRRSCAERLLDAGVPPMTIARVLRHASWETTRRHYAPGDVQKDAGILKEQLERSTAKQAPMQTVQSNDAPAQAADCTEVQRIGQSS